MGYPLNIIQSLSSTYCKYTSEFSLNLSSHCNWTPRMESRDMIACKVVPPPKKSCFLEITNPRSQLFRPTERTKSIILMVTHHFCWFSVAKLSIRSRPWRPGPEIFRSSIRDVEWVAAGSHLGSIASPAPGQGKNVRGSARGRRSCGMFFCGCSHHLRSSVVICCNDICNIPGPSNVT